MIPKVYADGARIRVESPYGPILATLPAVYAHLVPEIVEKLNAPLVRSNKT